MAERGVPVNIHIETRHWQDGEQDDLTQDVAGHYVQVGDTFYLRYDEQLEGQPAAVVTLRIKADGTVRLSRNHEELQMKLFFAANQRVEATYRTPYGLIPIDTETTNLNVAVNRTPLMGTVAIDYRLYTDGQPLGKYQIRLHFNA